MRLGKTAALLVGLQIFGSVSAFAQIPELPKGYFSIRLVAEKAGYTVKWEESSRSVRLIGDEEEIRETEPFRLADPASLSAEEKSFVEKHKETKGVHQLGNLYVIALGPTPNPGYGIQLVKNEQSWEQLFVHIQRTKPEEGQMYAQVISYPYLIGRVDLPPYTTVRFIDADTGNELFKQKSPQPL